MNLAAEVDRSTHGRPLRLPAQGPALGIGLELGIELDEQIPHLSQLEPEPSCLVAAVLLDDIRNADVLLYGMDGFLQRLKGAHCLDDSVQVGDLPVELGGGLAPDQGGTDEAAQRQQG